MNNFIKFGDFYKIEIFDKNKNIKGYLMIDLDDYEKCKDLLWNITKNGYGVNNRYKFLIHRYIMNVYNPRVFIDHINGNKLDNRKVNLRTCTHQENCRNARNISRSYSCNIIGVRKDKRCLNSWRAQIYYDKNKKLEKTFKSIEQAIEQRLKWELEYFNEFSPQIDIIKNKYPHLLSVDI